ncbi:MAG: lysyl oxidase family protein [Archangium sp.]|nr:lysyl oxidase family protein [Archangium sp.]
MRSDAVCVPVWNPTWQEGSGANSWWAEYAVAPGAGGGSVVAVSLRLPNGTVIALANRFGKWVNSTPFIATNTQVIVLARNSLGQTAQTLPFQYLTINTPVTDPCNGIPEDAGVVDAGAVDAGVDAGVRDAGVIDAGVADAGCAPPPWNAVWSQGSGANIWWVEYVISGSTVASASLELPSGSRITLSSMFGKWVGSAPSAIPVTTQVIVHATNTLGQAVRTVPFRYLADTTPQTAACGTGGGGGGGTDGGTGGGGGTTGSCSPGCTGGQLCCQVSSINTVPAAQRTFQCLPPVSGRCPAADLVVDQSRLLDFYLETRTYGANACVLNEGCIDASGTRRLLRFTLVSSNQGERDVVLGTPPNPSIFQYDTCHGHYHFPGYAQYRLVDANGSPVALGRKQSFCLMDGHRLSGSQPSRYTCDNQGMSAGWADTYVASLDCQWIDVTSVPAGNYFLEVTVNPEQNLLESDYSNNVSRVPVTIP